MDGVTYKLKFKSGNDETATTKQIPVTNEDAQDSDLKAVGAAIGELLSSFVRIEQFKVVATDLDAA